ncbi:hypothetical protein BJV82DRAFT_563737 [Fennellomyces sp. T-0311]|nr:hypothetical protein BJV82DRAFT_563737 [Fennellomyces sp. T-0311]
MLSIFKAVRDNNVETVRDLVQLASAGTTTTSANYTFDSQQQQNRQLLQRYWKATGQKQFNINKRSIRGRTALHCAATWNRVEIAKILIDCPLVNINLQDRENGWTALHRALYLGNLEIALLLIRHGDADLSIKDWEGIRPLELVTLTLHNFPIPKNVNMEQSSDDDLEQWKNVVNFKQTSRSGGTDLYSWGSNTNYLLGFRDSENRANPEHVHLDLESQQIGQIMQRVQVVLESVKMSKNHMAVLTSEPKHNLLVCGFGRGGRLGIGSDLNAQLVPVPVQWHERIVAVALGRDHTVAVSERGNVVTFGSNEFGQLGYETEDMQQLVPRKIQAPSLKRQEIVGAAASTVHSVVYTETDLFTFGYNKGQLGYHAAGDDIRQATPRKVALNSKIKQVVAIEYATAVLLESKDVILLCNHTQQKVIFATSRFPATMQLYTSAATYMVKLLQSGDEYLGAISNMGEVYLWTCRPNTKQGEKGRAAQKQATVISAPKRVYDLKKPHLAAIDASIGHHGELIVCTVAGQVFVGHPTKDGYKYRIIPKLQRCIQVCASPSGAFAAVRAEVKTKDVLPMPSSFSHDVSCSLPHMTAADQLDKQIYDLKRQKEYELEQVAQRNEEMDVEPEETTVQENIIMETFDSRVDDAVDAAWNKSQTIASNDSTLDVVFILGKRRIYCHSCILIARSRFFKRLFKQKRVEHSGLDITWVDKRVEIRIMQTICTSALLLFFDYLYTDIFTHPMSAYYKQPNLSRDNGIPTAKTVQNDLAALAAIFEMDTLHDSALLSYANTPQPTLKTDILRLFNEQTGCNVALELKDGQMLCHEFVLRQRCPFFEALFEPGSIWTQARREQVSPADPYLHIQMTHISMEVMKPLLQYLYGDLDENKLFGDTIKETSEEMMDLLIEVLCVSDELLLCQLKRSCERALVRFLKLRTASQLLQYSDLYLAEFLKASCLDFIAANLDIFITSGMLDTIDSSILQELELHVRYNQALQSPSVRSIMLSSPAPITGEEDQDEEFESSLHTLSREDAPIVSNYYETLVTVLPETPASPLTPKSEEDEGVFAMDEDQQRSKKKPSSKYLPADGKNQQQASASSSTGSTTGGSTWHGWAPTPAMSVGSYESKMPLREVLEQHPKPNELSSTPPSSWGKASPPHILKKLSQKERRKIQQQEMAAAAAVAATPRPVWGKVNVQAAPIPTEPTPVPLTKDTIATRKQSLKNGAASNDVTEDGSSKGKKIYISKEEFHDTLDESRRQRSKSDEQDSSFNPQRSLGAGFSFTPIRRKHAPIGRQNSQEEQQLAGSFQAIQKQQEQEDLWIKGKQARKNLIRIQAEERAVESLRQFYVQTLDAKRGEWFEVKIETL